MPQATKPLNPAALRASGCWVSLNFFREQYPGLLGSSDERLARYSWWFFSTDYGKACFDCGEPRLARRPRPIPQQNFGRVGYGRNNSVAIDPAGLNDDGLSETSRTHDSLQEQAMLASADPLRHIKRRQVAEGMRLARCCRRDGRCPVLQHVGLGPDFRGANRQERRYPINDPRIPSEGEFAEHREMESRAEFTPCPARRRW